MASKEINENPIIAKPKSWLSWDFTITFNDKEIAELDLVSFSKEGSFAVNHYKYKVSREGVFSGDFLLESYNNIVAKANKPSAFRRRFFIKALDQEFELCPKSIFGKSYVIKKNGKTIGSIKTSGFFSYKALIDISIDMPVHIKIFIFWLVLIMWRRRKNSKKS